MSLNTHLTRNFVDIAIIVLAYAIKLRPIIAIARAYAGFLLIY